MARTPPRLGARPGSPGEKIPVHAIWHDSVGPLLSLGMLTAAARAHQGGRLAATFDIGRPERADAFLAGLDAGGGPSILLCSDYVFTLDDNIATARAARRRGAGQFVVHGGPSAPKYGRDIEAFFDEFGDVVDVVVHGEGEQTLCDLLDAVGSLPDVDDDRLRQVDGISFRDQRTGELVHTTPRERTADLDALPSPYLTGEFDHIPAEQWVQPPYFETNRGCPYGCTFCDWGSATQSRIRKFDLGRVLREFAWAAEQGHDGLHICDANFGILPRDVDLAAGIAALRRRTGRPGFVMFTPAKNTTRHLTLIFDELAAAGVAVSTAISLQTTDEDTLEAVARKNISTDGYLRLAADLRRRGHALQGDLILGLPGQTYDSYRADLQFMLDHEIMPRTFPLRLLPNAPMNAPEYRERYGISVNEHHVVSATASMTAQDRARMLQLRRVESITERYGLLRHPLRYLQWDHGVVATDVMDRLVDLVVAGDPAFPVLAEVLRTFEHAPVPAAGWSPFYEEVAELLGQMVVGSSSGALATALAVQQFLMPVAGRAFPEVLEMEHDYVRYYADATAELYRSGHAGGPPRPLATYGPGTLTVSGDPLGLCSQGLRFVGASDDESFEGDFHIGALAANELGSPLARILPRLAGEREMVQARLSLVPPHLPTLAVHSSVPRRRASEQPVPGPVR